jgi:hypothetical protein
MIAVSAETTVSRIITIRIYIAIMICTHSIKALTDKQYRFHNNLPAAMLFS